MIFSFLFSTVFFIGALIIVTWLHNQSRLEIQTPHVAPPSEGRLISVIVPARNEEKNIRRCVEAILAQDYPDFQALVLDDRSTDATSAILAELSARDSRLVVVHGRELPAGWAGKPHALHQAAASATGEWLLFLDADTYLHPNALSAALASAQKTEADLYTVMTEQILGSFWEKTVMPLVFTALSVGFSPRKVNDPKSRDAIANGQFIFIRRAAYHAIGGHQAVKDQIVEDKALAEKVKWSGQRLVIADGRGIARTRMYTDLPSMWEGWTKNIYLGLSDHPALLLLGAFGALLALMAALVLPAWPIFGILWYANGGGWMSLAIILEALLVWIYIILARMKINHLMGISRWYAFTTPLGAGVFAAMMLTSAWKVLSGQGVTWKGRNYKQ
ncbi:MAG: glycosyltransferase [Anaerolineae bacterium]|nr:glycosyltransferase [Anaerolineae bacterium]